MVQITTVRRHFASLLLFHHYHDGLPYPSTSRAFCRDAAKVVAAMGGAPIQRSIDPTDKAAEHYCRSSIFGGRLAIPLLQRPILPMASSSLKDDIGSVATCGINHSRAVSFELPRRCYLCATSFFVGKPHTNLVIHSQKEIETTIACGLIAGNIFGRGGRRRKR
jgi:hypothetical protein